MEGWQMTDATVNSSVAAVPPYKMRTPNESIKLYSGKLAFTTGNKTIELNGEINFEWLPSPDVSVVARTQDSEMGDWGLQAMFTGNRCEIATPSSRCPAPIFLKSIGSDQLLGDLNGSLEIGDGGAPSQPRKCSAHVR
jgi:hypothetical protein